MSITIELEAGYVTRLRDARNGILSNDEEHELLVDMLAEMSIPMISDAEALDQLAAFMNRPGQWNGADVCEVAAELIQGTGREILVYDE